MGSFIELNDTLRITKAQGFPAELDVAQHQQNPYSFTDVEDKVFMFTAKEKIRVYHQPPVRNFLVEELDGKWLYWGLCHILTINHDYINGVTSGTYKIIRLNSPEEMKQAFELVDSRPELNYFKS
jgi:hypothetical protein